MKKTERPVDGWLALLPEDAREDMQTLDALISEVMEGHDRVLYAGAFWGGSDQEIIGYGTYSYTRADKKDVEWFVIGLALQKRYISIYISAVEDGKYLSETYGPDLGKVKVGKSSIGFGHVADIDLDKLRTLLERARDLQG